MTSASVVVYTALFGRHDRLLEQPEMEDARLLCFTDDPSVESRRWEVRVVEPPAHPRRAARAVKTDPEGHLPPHEWSIWIDARLSVRADDFVSRLLAAASPKGMAVMAHHQRADVYAEAELVYRMGFDTSPALLDQVRRYREAGLPPGSGLYSTMAVARRSGDATVRRIDERWADEIDRGSVRDQIALPYVTWDESFQPGVVDLDPYANELYVLNDHLTPRRYPSRTRQLARTATFRWRTRARAVPVRRSARADRQ